MVELKKKLPESSGSVPVEPDVSTNKTKNSISHVNTNAGLNIRWG